MHIHDHALAQPSQPHRYKWKRGYLQGCAVNTREKITSEEEAERNGEPLQTISLSRHLRGGEGETRKERGEE